MTNKEWLYIPPGYQFVLLPFDRDFVNVIFQPAICKSLLNTVAYRQKLVGGVTAKYAQMVKSRSWSHFARFAEYMKKDAEQEDSQG